MLLGRGRTRTSDGVLVPTRVPQAEREGRNLEIPALPCGAGSSCCTSALAVPLLGRDAPGRVDYLVAVSEVALKLPYGGSMASAENWTIHP
jgi:hypothetical protein